MKIIVKIIHDGLPVEFYECVEEDKKSKVKLSLLISQTKNWKSVDHIVYNGFEVVVEEHNVENKYCFNECIPLNFNSFL